MCGIAGIIRLDGKSPSRRTAWGMVESLVHRGPDGAGALVEGNLAAGMRRLAVIDVEGGQQPATNATGLVSVLFNGEIYNHVTLREELERKGITHRTRSDTEVLANLYARDGLGMFGRLNGMYAVCVHDALEDKVVLARDPAGIKPLWIAERDGVIAFASEVKALVDAGFAGELDEVALCELATTQLISGGRSLYRGVRALRPGYALVVEEGRAREVRVDTLVRPRGRPRTRELRALVELAVEARLISDVPLGVFLSGGLDSAVVLACAARRARGRLDAFTVGFEGLPGEVDDARETAEALGARHHEVRVSAAQLADVHEGLIAHLGAPIVDPALLPTRVLASFAKERVTVVLTGEGADELFGGYRRHLLGRVPRLGALGALAPRAPGRGRQAFEALAEHDAVARYLSLARVMSGGLASTLFSPEVLAAAVGRAVDDVRSAFVKHRGLEAELVADRERWLPANLLPKVDLATMAASLEARVPLLDGRVASAAFALGGRVPGKLALRRAFWSALPPEVLVRKKRGFDLPLDEWLRGPWAGHVDAALDGLDAWVGLDAARARALVRAHREGERGVGLVVFLLWSVGRFLQERR
jgi:asparagine synthase (glutamine-hydrolysing)